MDVLLQQLSVALLVLQVTDCDPRLPRCHPDDDLPIDTGRNAVAVLVYEVDIEQGRRDAHGPRLRFVALPGPDYRRRLGLPERLHELQSGLLQPHVVCVGAERLPGDAGVGERGQVVPFDPGVQEHPEHGGRAAEGGDPVLLDLVHDIGRFELVELVDEDPGLQHPGGVQLPPGAFDPSGVGDREVQSVGVHAVPVHGRQDMAQRVRVVVEDHLRIACGPRCEVHQHGVLGAVRDPGPFLGCGLHARVEVYPSLPLAVDHELELQRGDVLRDVHLFRYIAGPGAHAGLDHRRVDTVLDVVLPQHESRRNHDGSHLVERHREVPELDAVLHHHEDVVALADSHRREVVGSLVGHPLDLAEGEHALVAGNVAPLEGPSVGFRLGDPVDDVVSEVESRRDVDMRLDRPALGILLCAEVFLPEADQSPSPFLMTMARNVHPSLEVAIMP